MSSEPLTAEEWQGEMKMLKQRYAGFNLTDEQARKVHRHEEEKGQFVREYSFSMWEEWDYDSWFFETLLSASQFRVFEEYREACIKGYNDSEKNSDEKDNLGLAIAQETIDFYGAHFLPELFARNIGLFFGWLGEEKEKIQLLKTEYRRFLQRRRRKLLVEHFRQHKTFQPNKLELLLLRNKASWLRPDYSLFRSQADDAVKAVCVYLEKKLQYSAEILDENPDENHVLHQHTTGIRQLLSEQKKLIATQAEKFRTNPGPGWHFSIKDRKDPEAGVKTIMSLLLCDSTGYGLLG